MSTVCVHVSKKVKFQSWKSREKSRPSPQPSHRFPGDSPRFWQDTKVDNGRRCLSPWTARRWSDGSDVTMWPFNTMWMCMTRYHYTKNQYTQKKPWFKQITWRQFDIGTERWWQFVFNPELQKPAGFWSNHSDMGLISIQLRFEEHIGIEKRKDDSQMENSNKRYFSICGGNCPPKLESEFQKRMIFFVRFFPEGNQQKWIPEHKGRWSYQILSAAWSGEFSPESSARGASLNARCEQNRCGNPAENWPERMKRKEFHLGGGFN